MSTADPLGAKIQAKIQWHHSEIKRLQAIIDEFEVGGGEGVGKVPAPARRKVRTAPPPPQHAKPTPRRSLGKPTSSFLGSVRSVLGEGESLTSREIADRLKAAGYKSEAENYYATVYNQLVSWAGKGVGVVKVGDRSTGVSFRRK